MAQKLPPACGEGYGSCRRAGAAWDSVSHCLDGGGGRVIRGGECPPSHLPARIAAEPASVKWVRDLPRGWPLPLPAPQADRISGTAPCDCTTDDYRRPKAQNSVLLLGADYGLFCSVRSAKGNGHAGPGQSPFRPTLRRGKLLRAAAHRVERSACCRARLRVLSRKTSRVITPTPFRFLTGSWRRRSIARWSCRLGTPNEKPGSTRF